MRKEFIPLFFILISSAVFAQTVDLTFTGRDAIDHHIQLNRIVITNLTKNWQETIYWPDTVLIMQNGTGVNEYIQNGGFVLSQNNPNPFHGTTTVNLSIPEPVDVSVEITDVTGRLVEMWNTAYLQQGIHQFRVTLSAVGVYVLTARFHGEASSVKMVNLDNGGSDVIEYAGFEKTMGSTSHSSAKLSNKGATTNAFEYGDLMEYVGYATINDSIIESEHIIQNQDSSQLFELLFDADVTAYVPRPCPGMPTVTDVEGNVYNTLQIGSQCWMKENLRTSHYSDGTAIPVIEQNYYYSDVTPYCYITNNDIQYLPVYGYLYNWPAVMHGSNGGSSTSSGIQGICPTGWHVPSDDEWNMMESLFTDADVTADAWRGDHATKLFTDEIGIWYEPDVYPYITDLNYSGFSVYPAGQAGGSWNYFGDRAYFWTATSSGSNVAIGREMNKNHQAGVFRYGFNTFLAFSLRCVMD